VGNAATPLINYLQTMKDYLDGDAESRGLRRLLGLAPAPAPAIPAPAPAPAGPPRNWDAFVQADKAARAAKDTPMGTMVRGALTKK